MRKLTIRREKSFIGCLAKMKIYLEDSSSDEIKLPIVDENGEQKNISCRKIGELKNGEEKTFHIEDGALRVFVIADKLSKNYCNEFYMLPEGDSDVALSGENEFNPATGNAFRFAGNTNAQALEGRKRGNKKSLGIIIITVIIGLILGFFIGFGITSGIFALLDDQPQDFAAGNMTITLNESFEQYNIPYYSAVYASNDVDVFINKYINKISSSANDSAVDFAQSIITNSRLNCKVESRDGLDFFISDSTEEDGKLYQNYYFAYKNGSDFWLVQFSVLDSRVWRYDGKIMKWAGSVRFD